MYGPNFAMYLYNLLSCIMVSRWHIELVIQLDFMCRRLRSLFLIYHAYFKHNIECIYQFGAKKNIPVQLNLNPVLCIYFPTISTQSCFGSVSAL